MSREPEKQTLTGTQDTTARSSSEALGTPGGSPEAVVTPAGRMELGPVTPGVFEPTVEWKVEPEPRTPQPLGQCMTRDEVSPEAMGAAEPPTVPPSSYAIVGEVARGGLGRILKAYDRRLGRSVALKELLHTSGDAAARFVREALVTARLQHPAIVPVYEAGHWTDGSPFYAMKLVSGRSLQEVIGQTRSLEERLALLPNMIAIAEAVAYAHSEGIVHRDLKPANVLVGSFGETVLIDWGLAKHIAEAGDSGDPTLPYPVATQDLTIAGSVLGTPAYMAPEQARGTPADQRGDVYALGAMLYHLLSGGPPYSGNSAKEVLQKVALASAPTPVEDSQPRAPPDLCAIVRKAMAPNPVDRYPTANELAADLKRFQTGQLVSAHVYSPLSLVLRWIARHRATVTVATVLALALIATAVVSVQRIVRERNRAEARTNELILMQARSSLESDPSATLAWLKTYPTNIGGWGALRVIAADAKQRGIARHVLKGHQGNVTALAFLPGGDRLASTSFDYTVRIWDLDSSRSRVLTGHEDVVTLLAASPDGKTLATFAAGLDLLVRIWDVETGTLIQALPVEKRVWFVAFSPDGKSLASCGDDGMVRLWDLSSGQARVLGNHPDRVYHVAFSPDGSKLASTSRDGSVRLWDLRSGRGRELDRHSASANRAVFSPDERQLASCSDDKTIKLWDLASGSSITLRGHEDWVNEIRFSPDGRTLASASEDKSIRLWDLEGHPTKVLHGHENAVKYVAFSPDGRTLASGSTDKTVRLWNLADGESWVLRGHSGPVRVVEFSPAGDTVASASEDDTLRVWEVARRPSVLRSAKPVRHIAFSPDSDLLLSGGDDRTVRLWNLRSGELRELLGHEGAINWVAFFPDGSTVASGSSDKTIRLWSLETGASRVLEGHSDAVNTLLITKDGKTLISGSSDASIRLWDVRSEKSEELRGHTNEVDSLALSPSNRLLASTGRDMTVRLWNLLTHQTQLVGTMDSRVRRVAFSKDERFLAAASIPVRLWDLRTGKAQDLPGQRLKAVDLAFSVDGKLVSGGIDKRLTVWDPSSGTTNTLSGHESLITSLDISPDGVRLVSASWYQHNHLSTLRLWDRDSGASRVLHGHSAEVRFVTFSPDGKTVGSASADGTVRVWSDDLPSEPTALHAWMERATDAVVGAR